MNPTLTVVASMPEALRGMLLLVRPNTPPPQGSAAPA